MPHSSDAIVWPRCLKCSRMMVLGGIDPESYGRETRIFECPRCRQWESGEHPTTDFGDRHPDNGDPPRAGGHRARLHGR
jgi:hypothetical protein